MDGMSLLDVLRGVMLDPAEQAAYNADPSAYLERFGYDDVDPADLSEAFGLVADTLPPDQAQAAWAAASTPDGDAFGTVTADFDSDNGAEPPEPDGGLGPGSESPGDIGETSLSFGQGEADDGPPAPAAVEPEAGDGGATAPGSDFEPAAPVGGESGLSDASGLDAGYADVADDFDDADGDGIDDAYDSDADGDGIDDAYDSGAGGTVGTDADGDGIDDAYDSGASGAVGTDADGDGIDDPYDTGASGAVGTDADGDGIDDTYDSGTGGAVGTDDSSAGGGFGGGLDADGDGIDGGYDSGLDDDLGDLDQIDGLDELSMPGPDDTDIGSF
jgi:large repetitive protein